MSTTEDDLRHDIQQERVLTAIMNENGLHSLVEAAEWRRPQRQRERAEKRAREMEAARRKP